MSLASALMDDCRSETPVVPQQQEHPGYADYIMHSTFLTDSSGSVLFSSSANLEELLQQLEAVESDDTNTTDTDIHTAL